MSGLALTVRRSSWELPPGPFTENKKRTVLLLTLRDSSGRAGCGEAAPLPGYSSDTLIEAAACLEGLTVASEAVEDLETILAAVRSVPRQMPSARFALETALLDLLGKRTGRPIWRLLGGAPQPVTAAYVVRPGVRPPPVATLKMKVGKDEETEEAEWIAGLRQTHPEAALRFDAGGRSLAPSVEHAILDARPEFVEEPCAAWSSGPPRIALDESLRGGDARALIESSARLSAVVLKPTTLGGVLHCRELAECARARGAYPVVSHTLEGATGWTAAAHLAIALGGTRAAGLYPWTGLIDQLSMFRDHAIVPTEEPGLGL